MKLGLLFGGRSGEHEISVRSARSIYGAAIEAGYDVTGIGITKEGDWTFPEDLRGFFASECSQVTSDLGPACWIAPGQRSRGFWFLGPSSCREFRPLDVVFPVLHGPFGEDGSVQGLLELADIPYVGSPLGASAVCMDKDVTKQLLAAAGVPHVPWQAVCFHEWNVDREKVLDRVLSKASFPAFVKPSGLGSSLGISKVKEPGHLAQALDEAFSYDSKVLVEPSQEGLLEVECSVLGNEEPEAAPVVGQILPAREFYDYEAKYVDENTRLLIPAPLGEDLQRYIGRVAVAGFKATGCKGMARVDFFVDAAKKKAYIGEINTIPGFTSISMYPKLWEASGLSYPELIETLVNLAFERHESMHRSKLV